MRIAARQYSDDGQLAELDALLARSPDAVDVLFERACCLEDLGWDEAASQAYLAVLAHDPRHLGTLTNLGLMVIGRGDLSSARAFFTQAATHHPLSAIAHVNLGLALLEQGEVASAEAQYATALTIDREFFAALHGLAMLYERAGDATRAQAQFERAFEKRAAWTLPYAGTAPPVRVLLLVSARGGDIVTHPFLDDRIVQTTMFVPEGFRPGMPLPPHDVIFNGIGDADRCRSSLERARDLLVISPAQTINEPERVLGTGRADTAARLRSIPNAIVPRTERRPRGAFTPERLAAGGWDYPLLVRAPGFQAGRHFERVNAPGELDAVLARVPGDELYAIEFADLRDAGGSVRKYRMLFIDGRLYPVHLAISGDWKVHYFSADMAERADYRAEEAQFLADPRSVLGLRAMAALAAIGAALHLDYGGVDFALDAAGKVVVFEANATMAVYTPLAGEEWAYRRPPYDAVVAAVRAMIAERAATCRADPSSVETMRSRR